MPLLLRNFRMLVMDLKRIRICADDFGLNDAVNAGIIDLLSRRRLNAISCMSVCEGLEKGASSIQDLRKRALPFEVGLHLTFTEYRPLTAMPEFAPTGFPSIGKLLVKAHWQRMPEEEIRREILAQLDRFETIFGFSPHFVDGHQHVHLLPVIRRQVLAIAKERLGKNVWLRSCSTTSQNTLHSGSNLLRTWLLNQLSKPFQREAEAKQLRLNDAFFGVNAFDVNADFSRLMKKWLMLAGRTSGDLLFMCHPAMKRGQEHNLNVYADPIAEHRVKEYDYFLSDEFQACLDANKFSLI